MLFKIKNLNEWQTVLLLSAVGLIYRALHFVVFSNKLVPEQDAARYIRLGRNFAAGNFYGVLDDYWPPLYPLLIGSVSFVIDDLLLPAIFISIVFGSLAVPLTYYFVKQSYGSKPAVIAASIAIFYPFLINSVFGLGSENVYLPLIIGALIAGWIGITKGSLFPLFVTGILLSLSYLTRPEAIGYLAFFAGCIAVRPIWHLEARGTKILPQIGVLLFGFALLSTPYILYLKSETGTWTISGKTSENFASGVFSGDSDEADQGNYREQKEESRSKALIMNVGYNLRRVHVFIGNIMPLLLMPLLGLGLFGKRWDQQRVGRESYLVSFCLVTIGGYIATWVIQRYFYVLLPIFFGWIALGIIVLEGWLRETRKNWSFSNPLLVFGHASGAALVCIVAIFIYMFSANFYVRSKDSEWQGRAYEERDAGLWLRENGVQHPLIYSGSFRPIFYAEGERFNAKSNESDKVVNEIRAAGVDYVIDSERIRRASSRKTGLTDQLRNDPSFELVYERNDHPGYRISIYQVK